MKLDRKEVFKRTIIPALLIAGAAACTKEGDQNINITPSLTPTNTLETTNQGYSELATAMSIISTQNSELNAQGTEIGIINHNSSVTGGVESSNPSNQESKPGIVVINPTATPEPTMTSTSIETASDTENPTTNPQQVYSGEFVYNNFDKVYGQTDPLMDAVVGELNMEYTNFQAMTDDQKKDALRTNSTFSSLVNKFAKGTSNDPITEPGLGQTEDDFKAYKPVSEIISQKDTLQVGSIFHLNTNGLMTGGVWADANDRDAAAAIIATGLAATYGNINPAETITEAWSNPKDVAVIRSFETQIFNQIQNQEYTTSISEQKRRKDNDKNDQSVQLPSVLRESDDWESCDVYRPTANTRVDQLQSLRPVEHINQDMTTAKVENFGVANSANEKDLIVGVVEQSTKIWDADAFTFRSYNNNVDGEIQSTVGEEMEPCGQSAPVEKPTTQPTQNHPETPIPGNTPEHQPTPTQQINTPKPPTPTQVWPTPMPTNADLFTQVPSPVATTDKDTIPPTSVQ
ncbi:MAG TPA: hypothetical protein VG895_00665 [Patescibacteria group bacterium]|nr:hypothetical protein [Patescibacteria group bacterium]